MFQNCLWIINRSKPVIMRAKIRLFEPVQLENPSFDFDRQYLIHRWINYDYFLKYERTWLSVKTIVSESVENYGQESGLFFYPPCTAMWNKQNLEIIIRKVMASKLFHYVETVLLKKTTIFKFSKNIRDLKKYTRVMTKYRVFLKTCLLGKRDFLIMTLKMYFHLEWEGVRTETGPSAWTWTAVPRLHSAKDIEYIIKFVGWTPVFRMSVWAMKNVPLSYEWQ